MPFGKIPATIHEWEEFNHARSSLEQMLELRLWGIIHGKNGVGKSQLVHAVAESLPEKVYRVIRMSHSTLSASDMLRSLCHALEIQPRFRRSDTVEQLCRHWQKLLPLYPVVLYDEAQNLNAQSLEELRLLSCAGNDSRNLFSLVLIGDDHLIPRLQMGIHHALLQRMGFQIQLHPMNAEQSRAYLSARLQEVCLSVNPFDEAATQLLVQATHGIPRAINRLAQASMQNAMRHASKNITAQHVQKAIETLHCLTQNTKP